MRFHPARLRIAWAQLPRNQYRGLPNRDMLIAFSRVAGTMAAVPQARSPAPEAKEPP